MSELLNGLPYLPNPITGPLNVTGNFSATGTGLFGGNLTVSGTGTSSVGGNWTVSGNVVQVGAAGTGTGGNVRVVDDSGAVKWLSGVLGSAGARDYSIYDVVNSRYAFTIASSSGNLLLGTTTDSANGKLQLATHTTSAGGIGFGTDVSLYRSSAGFLTVDHIGGTTPAVALATGGTARGYLQSSGNAIYLDSTTAGASLYFRSGAQTLALTLDSSQNATFAGQIKTLYGGTWAVYVAPSTGADRDIAIFGVSGATNGLTMRWNNSTSTMRINIANLPTSATGLAAGDLYNSAGTIKIA